MKYGFPSAGHTKLYPCSIHLTPTDKTAGASSRMYGENGWCRASTVTLTLHCLCLTWSREAMGEKKRRACRIYVEPTLYTSSPAVRCCGRITPAPCAPRACHNSGEPCRILVEGCCALLLGGLPASLPRHILVKPCLFLVKPRLFRIKTRLILVKPRLFLVDPPFPG